FSTLARGIETEAIQVPVGRARSIIIEEPIIDRDRTIPLVPAGPIVPLPSDGRVLAAPAPSDDATERVDTFEAHADLRNRTSTLIGLKPNRASTDSGLGQQSRAPAPSPSDSAVIGVPSLRPTPAGGLPPMRPPATPSTGVPNPVVDTGRTSRT